MPEEKFRISEISYTNVNGLRSLKLEGVGSILQIKGPNGSGKSSIISGTKGGLGLEGDVENIRNTHADADAKVEVDYWLSDGKDAKRYHITRQKGKVVVQERVPGTQAYEKLRRPQEFVDTLIDKHLIDPGDFVRADPKRQVDLFLAALPLELRPEQIRAALGDEKYAEVAAIADKGEPPLKTLLLIRDALYETRRGLSTSHQKSKAAAEKMKLQIPEHLDDAEPEGLAALEKERDERFEKMHAAETAAAREHDKALTDLVADFKAFEAKRREELAVAIAKLQGDCDAEIATERDACAKMKDVIAAKKAAALAAIEPDRQAHAEIKEKLATARAQADNATKFRTLKEQADGFEKEAEGLLAKATTYTEALDKLQALKASLLSTAPVPGLTVDEDGTVKVDTVPINKLNTQQLTDLGALVAIMRAKTKALPLVILDNAEMYDKAHRAALIERFIAEGIQVFMAFVDEGELEVV